jgi:hypothetical protein
MLGERSLGAGGTDGSKSNARFEKLHVAIELAPESLRSALLIPGLDGKIPYAVTGGGARRTTI